MRLARWGPLAGVLVAGCYAAPPPPASAAELVGCTPGSHGFLDGPACASDRDCVLCGASSEPASSEPANEAPANEAPARDCGTVRTRREIALSNPVCPAPDEERCAGARAACCGGHCVLTLGPPPL
ncbi:MAG: hypothetical protein IT378_07750 [Sandaracinaceae bacterium]|nr:hypothetical protein [Sandaracinaceae bacterium]